MSKIKALLIPHDEHQLVEELEYESSDLSFMQTQVGGLVQFVDVDSLQTSLVMNEEGKIRELPLNNRATVLLWAFEKHWVRADYLVGDVLVVGMPDDEGDTQSAPDSVIEMLTKPGQYDIQVQTGKDPEWSTNAMTFSDWESAALFVIDLGIRWTIVTATRIKRIDR